MTSEEALRNKLKDEVLDRPIGDVITDLRGLLEAADEVGNIVNVVSHANEIGVLERVVDKFTVFDYKLTMEGRR